MITLQNQQIVWKIGIEHGKAFRYTHEKQHLLFLGKTLLDAAFLEAIERYSQKETINCFITGFVNGYLSV